MTTIKITDSHCHPDRYDDMLEVLERARKTDVDVFFITFLPSDFQRYRALDLGDHVRLGLGFHPMASRGFFPWQPEIDIEEELRLFEDLAPGADWIGEIGYDFSPDGKPFRAVQERMLSAILQTPSVTGKFLSVHSRYAQSECVDTLRAAGAQRVAIHGNGFTGAVDDALYAVEAGFYVSLVVSNFEEDRGRAIARSVPRDRVLIETDAPFGIVGGRAVEPHEVRSAVRHLAAIWELSEADVAAQLEENLKAVAS